VANEHDADEILFEVCVAGRHVVTACCCTVMPVVFTAGDPLPLPLTMCTVEPIERLGSWLIEHARCPS
jgi:hypothetical protein